MNLNNGELIVRGQAVNATETTFDHATVRVDLYDENGTLLNPSDRGQIPRTAGDRIRPGDVVRFEWEETGPPG